MNLKFTRLDPRCDIALWRDLWRRSSRDHASFRGFRFQAERVFRGQYELLSKKFVLSHVGLESDQPQRQLWAAATLFAPRSSGGINMRGMNTQGLSVGGTSVGGLLIDPELSSRYGPESLRLFAQELVHFAGSQFTAPMNGHINLGLSIPSPATRAQDISFLCASKSKSLEDLFFATGAFAPGRTLFALSTPITPELLDRIEQGTEALAAKGFHSRPISPFQYKRDIFIYHRLVNASMAGHPHFFALSFAEEWELLKASWPLIVPQWFRFLLHGDREIGFCLALPDYNPFLKSQRSDAANGLAALASRHFHLPRRARIVFSGILPEYQGRGLFKAVRHAVIRELGRSGVQSFESSYVDEANLRSLGNVKSTGGIISHSFQLFEPRS